MSGAYNVVSSRLPNIRQIKPSASVTAVSVPNLPNLLNLPNPLKGSLSEKIKNSACIEKAGVVSYGLQGRLGLRRVVRVPRSAERKTDA